MPLGFAKDILAKGSAAPPAAPMTDRGYWVSTGTVASGANGANVVADRGSSPASGQWSWDGDSTFMVWFKGSTSDMDGEASFAHVRLNDQMPIIQNLTKGTGVNVNGFVKNLTTPKTESWNISVSSFDATYLNNSWHQLVVSVSISSTTYKSQVYLDGVQLRNASTTGKTASSSSNSSRYYYFGAGSNNSPGGNYENDPDGAHKLKIGMIFYDNVFTDLTTNITKFYNGGGVDLGTDGTASGLARPELYITADTAGNMIGSSGTLKNGGSFTLSLIKAVREGTGNIEVFTSGGPT
jgi:hypothetical protein